MWKWDPKLHATNFDNTTFLATENLTFCKICDIIYIEDKKGRKNFSKKFMNEPKISFQQNLTFSQNCDIIYIEDKERKSFSFRYPRVATSIKPKSLIWNIKPSKPSPNSLGNSTPKQHRGSDESNPSGMIEPQFVEVYSLRTLYRASRLLNLGCAVGPVSIGFRYARP